jgi:protoporphyrin/coproporphyrin ferrochelatase
VAAEPRTAVVLYNLGGPDGPQAVQPFLFNLFNDPAIIRQPAPLRWLLARLISRRRAPVARAIYARIGGASPIVGETRAQAAALRTRLADGGGDVLFEVFVAMRYWHPLAEETVAEVVKWGAERVVLLPLYPQFSTTTTASFEAAWKHAAAEAGLAADTVSVCCYPDAAGFVDALARLTGAAIEEARAAAGGAAPRVLFSAHGIPRKFVDDGDPYPLQIEATVAALVAKLAIKELDYRLCYQSRVGRLEWLRPYTEDEIRQAGADGKALVVVPVAFVSEHSETLVELDLEYGELARNHGVPGYSRVATVGVEDAFIDALAGLARAAAASTAPALTGAVDRACPAGAALCPLVAAGSGAG